ncbi:hypothetical protein ACO0RG_000634 [Hanseniaspora osmophila]
MEESTIKQSPSDDLNGASQLQPTPVADVSPKLQDQGKPPKRKRRRTTVVCLNCKKRKIKCDRKKPACSNCVESNAAAFCFYVHPEWAIDNYITTAREGLIKSPPVGAAESGSIPNAQTPAVVPNPLANPYVANPLHINQQHQSTMVSNSDFNLKPLDNKKPRLYNAHTVLPSIPSKKLSNPSITEEDLATLKSKNLDSASSTQPSHLAGNVQDILSQLTVLQQKMDFFEKNPPSLNVSYMGSNTFQPPIPALSATNFASRNSGINFYESYDSLEMKRSSDIDFKPFTTNALCCKDPYISVLFKYYNARSISRKIECELHQKMAKNDQLKRKSKVKESNVPHSIIDLMEFNNDPIPPPKTILDKSNKNGSLNGPSIPSATYLSSNTEQARNNDSTVITEAPFVNLQNPEGITKLQGPLEKHAGVAEQVGDMQFLKPNNKQQQQFLKHDIIVLLRKYKRSELDFYFNRFWKVIYPVFPIFDKQDYQKTLERVFVRDKDTGMIVDMDLSETFDLANVAIYLIMIRFSYLIIITQLKVSELERQMITKSKITIDFIQLANNVLSSYKVYRKSKLALLQALALLKYYSIFSVEDGDGNDLSQGITTNAIIAQLALNIGLNRDPSMYQHLNKSKSKMYLHRKVWWAVVSIDKRFCSLAGVLSNFNSFFMGSYCDTRFPTPSDYEVQDPIELKLCDILQRSASAEAAFTQVLEMVNKVSNLPELEELELQIAKMDKLLKQSGFSLGDLIRIPASNPVSSALNGNLSIQLHKEDDDDNSILLICMENFKKLELSLLAKITKTSLYHALLIYFESEKHQDIGKSRLYLNKLLSTIAEVCDISHNYLSHRYSVFINNTFDFHINRLLQASVEKCCLILSSIALRCCFAIPMLDPDAIPKKEKHYMQLFGLCLNLFNEMGSILFNNVGVKYYQGYKALLTLRFIFKVLNYYPVKYTGLAIFQYFILFYNNYEKVKSIPYNSSKLTKILDLNKFQRNITLDGTIQDLLLTWNIKQGPIQQGVTSSKYANILHDDDVVLECIETLRNCNALKNQLFEFKGSDSISEFYSSFYADDNLNENDTPSAVSSVSTPPFNPGSPPATSASTRKHRRESMIGRDQISISPMKHFGSTSPNQMHQMDRKVSENKEICSPSLHNIRTGADNHSSKKGKNKIAKRPFTIVTEHNPRNILNDDEDNLGYPSLLSDEQIVKDMIPGLKDNLSYMPDLNFANFLDDEHELFPTDNPFSLDSFLKIIDEADRVQAPRADTQGDCDANNTNQAGPTQNTSNGQHINSLLGQFEDLRTFF